MQVNEIRECKSGSRIKASAVHQRLLPLPPGAAAATAPLVLFSKESQEFQMRPAPLAKRTRPVGGTTMKLTVLATGQKRQPVMKVGAIACCTLLTHCKAQRNRVVCVCVEPQGWGARRPERARRLGMPGGPTPALGTGLPTVPCSRRKMQCRLGRLSPALPLFSRGPAGGGGGMSKGGRRAPGEAEVAVLATDATSSVLLAGTALQAGAAQGTFCSVAAVPKRVSSHR